MLLDDELDELAFESPEELAADGLLSEEELLDEESEVAGVEEAAVLDAAPRESLR